MPRALIVASSRRQTLFLTIILVTFVIQHGESNWLQGVMLLVAYFMIAAGFAVHS